MCENNILKIAVCSKNAAKNEAVKSVMDEFFENYELIPLSTESNVSETPVSDNEGLLGCKNRIESAKSQCVADLYVAMEGILDTNDFGTFLCGWTTIYNNKENEYYYGCSAKIRIPDEILKSMNKDVRLSEIVAQYVGSTDEEISLIGTNGMLTHGAYTRTQEFRDSVMCAISSKYQKLIK